MIQFCYVNDAHCSVYPHYPQGAGAIRFLRKHWHKKPSARMHTSDPVLFMPMFPKKSSDESIPSSRQEWKVEHLLKDITVVVLFTTLSNVDDWVEIAIVVENNEELLKKTSCSRMASRLTTHSGV